MNLKGKIVLITGATGSFEEHVFQYLLKQKLKKIIVLSKDELKQDEYEKAGSKTIRYLLGDIKFRKG